VRERVHVHECERERTSKIYACVRVGPSREFSIIHNPYSLSSHGGPHFTKFEIIWKYLSWPNGDLGIMSHLGNLRRKPEFVRGKWMENFFFLKKNVRKIYIYTHIYIYIYIYI